MVVYRKGLAVQEWVAACQALIERDLDNVVLLVGKEGSGKSTLAVALAKLLNPDLSLEDITFGVQEFLDRASDGLSPGHVVVADEILINKRKGSWGDTIELLDFLQRCRGLNLHLVLCFPHEELMDKAVLNYRVRYKIQVVRRGLAQVYETFTYYSPQGDKLTGWKMIAKWRYEENGGPFWQAYLAKKQTAMTAREDAQAKEEAPPDVWDIQELKRWDLENAVVAIPSD